ncbi:hypothetical protein M0R45_008781 [Rubus argutus]|uniref:Uncharacterized protein n=1 Tax=Rubus argutus TaxID=59490 RepID=A0AAW1Y269_RUBAR
MDRQAGVNGTTGDLVFGRRGEMAGHDEARDGEGCDGEGDFVKFGLWFLFNCRGCCELGEEVEVIMGTGRDFVVMGRGEHGLKADLEWWFGCLAVRWVEKGDGWMGLVVGD